MSNQYIKVLVPLAMQLGTTREEVSAALATRVVRWAHGFVQRLWKPDEPRSAEDVLALARSVERQMPNLAAELRFFALYRPEAPD